MAGSPPRRPRRERPTVHMRRPERSRVADPGNGERLPQRGLSLLAVAFLGVAGLGRPFAEFAKHTADPLRQGGARSIGSLGDCGGASARKMRCSVVTKATARIGL